MDYILDRITDEDYTIVRNEQDLSILLCDIDDEDEKREGYGR